MSHGRAGQARLGCFLAIVAIGCFVAGGQAVYTGIRNRSPLEVSCADYLAQKPAGEWLRLKGCALDLADATFFKDKDSDRIKTAFIPIRPVGASDSAPLELLLQTQGSAYLDVLNKIQAVGNDEARLTEYMTANADKVFPEKDVEGLIAWGIDVEEKQLDEIRRLNKSLKPDFKILMDGAAPSLGFGLLMIAGGFVAGAILWRVIRAG